MKQNASYQSSIGRKIKMSRINADLTQNELGELIGMSGAAVCSIEIGKHNTINMNSIKKICDVLDIDFIYLMMPDGGQAKATQKPVEKPKPKASIVYTSNQDNFHVYINGKAYDLVVSRKVNGKEIPEGDRIFSLYLGKSKAKLSAEIFEQIRQDVTAILEK